MLGLSYGRLPALLGAQPSDQRPATLAFAPPRVLSYLSFIPATPSTPPLVNLTPAPGPPHSLLHPPPFPCRSSPPLHPRNCCTLFGFSACTLLSKCDGISLTGKKDRVTKLKGERKRRSVEEEQKLKNKKNRYQFPHPPPPPPPPSPILSVPMKPYVFCGC